MRTLYGIKNCDSVKKARAWLEQNNLDYQFYDYKIEGVSLQLLQKFAKNSDWEVLLNRRSTSWRQLSDAQKNDLNTESALQLLQQYPTLIKRPILEAGDVFLIGFNADEYQQAL